MPYHQALHLAPCWSILLLVKCSNGCDDRRTRINTFKTMALQASAYGLAVNPGELVLDVFDRHLVPSAKLYKFVCWRERHRYIPRSLTRSTEKSRTLMRINIATSPDCGLVWARVTFTKANFVAPRASPSSYAHYGALCCAEQSTSIAMISPIWQVVMKKTEAINNHIAPHSVNTRAWPGSSENSKNRYTKISLKKIVPSSHHKSIKHRHCRHHHLLCYTAQALLLLSSTNTKSGHTGHAPATTRTASPLLAKEQSVEHAESRPSPAHPEISIPTPTPWATTMPQVLNGVAFTRRPYSRQPRWWVTPWSEINQGLLARDYQSMVSLRARGRATAAGQVAAQMSLWLVYDSELNRASRRFVMIL